MSRRLLGLLPLLAGCKALPLPPFIAPLRGTAADEKGATTGMLIIGMAGNLGGGGIGVALRVEHQTAVRTAYGVELTAGSGDQLEYADGKVFTQRLLALRGYGRRTPASSQDTALLYGAGLSVTSSGMITASLHGGGELAYTNDHAVPYLAIAGALAVPVRAGRPIYQQLIPFGALFGQPEPTKGFVPKPERQRMNPHWDVFAIANLGLVVPVGGTGNTIALDVGGATTLRDPEVIFVLSAADAQRHD